jgi:adenylate kinase
VVFDPPQVEGVCDACGGELFQRDDDNEATVRNRLAVYRRQTEPLIGYYRDKGILATVYGGGRGPDQVFADVETLLNDVQRA